MALWTYSVRNRFQVWRYWRKLSMFNSLSTFSLLLIIVVTFSAPLKVWSDESGCKSTVSSISTLTPHLRGLLRENQARALKIYSPLSKYHILNRLTECLKGCTENQLRQLLGWLTPATPSLEINSNAEPFGTASHRHGHFNRRDNASAQNILIEDQSARFLAESGYLVYQNPKSSHDHEVVKMFEAEQFRSALNPRASPDYLLEGQIFDHFVTRSSHAQQAIKRISSKTSIVRQTNRIVVAAVSVHPSQVTRYVEELRKQLWLRIGRDQLPHLEQVIGIFPQADHLRPVQIFP